MVCACNGKVWESAGGDKKELSGKFVSDIGGKPRCSGQTKIYRIFESSAGAYGNRVDPSDVNGYNMLYPLANFKQVNWQGVNGTIYALLALDSKNYEIPKLTEEDLGKGPSLQRT